MKRFIVLTLAAIGAFASCERETVVDPAALRRPQHLHSCYTSILTGILQIPTTYIKSTVISSNFLMLILHLSGAEFVSDNDERDTTEQKMILRH